ncbi:hypothetical protein ACQY0O_008268 [Thecaphora frezii]
MPGGCSRPFALLAFPRLSSPFLAFPRSRPSWLLAWSLERLGGPKSPAVAIPTHPTLQGCLESKNHAPRPHPPNRTLPLPPTGAGVLTIGCITQQRQCIRTELGSWSDQRWAASPTFLVNLASCRVLAPSRFATCQPQPFQSGRDKESLLFAWLSPDVRRICPGPSLEATAHDYRSHSQRSTLTAPRPLSDHAKAAAARRMTTGVACISSF